MKSLRRPVVHLGVTYEHEMDFYTSNVFSVRFKGRVLTPLRHSRGYICFRFPNNLLTQHQLLAETFPDLLSKSALASYYDLKIGRDRHELKTPTGFTFICNQVCPDHIDDNKTNNHHSNIMIVTQHENIIKCQPTKGRKYKCVYKRACDRYQAEIKWPNILDKNGKFFRIDRVFKTEEEAALGYNTMLEEAMLTIWGPDLGPKMYDFAYKNVIKAPIQQELTL